MSAYDCSFALEAVQALLACDDGEIQRLNIAIESLAEDPFRATQYVGRDRFDRVFPFLRIMGFAIGYWVDRPQRKVHIVEIRRLEM